MIRRKAIDHCLEIKLHALGHAETDLARRQFIDGCEELYSLFNAEETFLVRAAHAQRDDRFNDRDRCILKAKEHRKHDRIH